MKERYQSYLGTRKSKTEAHIEPVDDIHLIEIIEEIDVSIIDKLWAKTTG